MIITDTILLIDYQNVRDTGLKDLPAHRRLVMFVGKGQKPKADFVQDAMKRGVRLDLIPIAEDGKNNLDFHLAFYLGRLLAEEPYGEFIIISNDRDFEPLTLHLQSLGVSCERRGPTKPVLRAPATAAKPPRLKQATARIAPRVATPKPAPARVLEKPIAPKDGAMYEDALRFLRNAGKRRPTTHKKLLNSLQSRLNLKPPLGERLVQDLIQKGVLSISNGAVIYARL